jgi:carotenoid cleavage dioxygenase-like enzyme
MLGVSGPTRRAYELGFRSLDEEVSDCRLPVEGSVPDWLSGALVRNGPGSFRFGGERARHWFDGLAMLRRYGFDGGEVAYTNRFLRTDAYRDAQTGQTAGEFATGGGLRSVLRWVRALGPPTPTDNANVHVARLGDHYVALTEAPRRVAFDPVCLETRGGFRWRDDLPEHLATAHLTRDCVRGETVGFATEFGRQSRYHLYRVPDGQAGRERFATVAAEGPGYVHDCAVTADHVVLVETPLRVAVLRALSPRTEGFLDLLAYDEDVSTRFVVVDRDSGDVVATPRTDPLFAFHHVNAYDDGGDVVVDLVTYPDDTIVRALSLAALADGGFAAVPDGRFDRFRLGLASGTVARTRQYDGGMELPTVPPAVRGTDYRYAYAQATDREGANGLVKVDVRSGTATEWWGRGLYVEEPRTVQRPGATAEDDGVVLAPALDTGRERSLLLVFDAASLTELARAPLPHALPFGFHGRFFPEAVP